MFNCKVQAGPPEVPGFPVLTHRPDRRPDSVAPTSDDLLRRGGGLLREPGRTFAEEAGIAAVDVATGSHGPGIGYGVGVALAERRLDRLRYRHAALSAAAAGCHGSR
jgi:hypothetical protein